MNSNRTFPQFPFIFLTILLILSLTLVIIWWMISVHSYNTLNSITENDFKAVEIRGDILYLDTSITMAARMYAFTKDKRWLALYQKNNPLLDHAIHSLNNYLDVSNLSQTLTEVELTNRRLDDIELKAFTLVDENKLDTAQQLLTSEAYENMRFTYTLNLDLISNEINKKVQAHLKHETNQASFISLIILFIFVSFVLIWVIAYKNLLQWRALEKKAAVAELASSISHEVNNPLAYVMSNFEVLNEEIDTLLPKIQESNVQIDINEVQTMLQETREGLTKIKEIIKKLNQLF